ncbi:MAG: phospholipase D-like domain-containing protein [Lentisphaeraceae bacterium]|nr:phospholipase D-like domain-containing protein [Lentisphaeraceae bacterium]
MNKKFIILFLTILISFYSSLSAEVKAFFNKDCEAALIAEIGRAKKSIHVAVYSFTRFNIANALSKAKSKGVDVKILWDKTQLESSEYGSKIFEILKGGNVEVSVIDKKSKMHHKFAVIDSNTVITGSFNFTTSAAKFNDENLVVFENKKAAEKFLKAWEAIFLEHKKSGK